MANVNSERGMLPSLEEVAFHLRIDADEANATLQCLMDAGFLDKVKGSKRLRIHNWKNRQSSSDTSRDRMRRHRERKCDVTGDVTSGVTVTPAQGAIELEGEGE